MSTLGERHTFYQQVQATREFGDLRRRLRRFGFPMSALFLVWYLVYVLLASYAPEFMATKVAGNVNVGVGNVGLDIGIFAAFVLLTLVVVYRAGRSNRTASDYYAAGRSFTGSQNGIAMSGDYCRSST
jgi:uncharacterized membrane protein (DUF485 family)